MTRVADRRVAKLVVAAAAAGLVLTPAFATGTHAKKRPAAVALSFDPVSSFTPANADPRLAAALAGKGLALTDFKFKPEAILELVGLVENKTISTAIAQQKNNVFSNKRHLRMRSFGFRFCAGWFLGHHCPPDCLLPIVLAGQRSLIAK